MTEPARHPIETFERQRDEYEDDSERPLGTYLGVLTGYGVSVAALGAIARWSGRSLPERIAPFDLALIGVATHKLSRRLAKDPVTSPLRAPFARFRGQSGPAEVQEDVRGGGVRHGVGELITCPFCLAQWVATGFSAGLVLAPRFTRLVAATFSTVAVSDFLQFAYARAEQAAG